MDRTEISELVSDWGGFEKLVSKLCESTNVTVRNNVVMIGKSGAPRQIDVVIESAQGLIRHLVLVECKYLNKAVKRETIDSFANTLKELNASKGVIFSKNGFQKGAIRQATSEGIELFQVRSLRSIRDREPLKSYTHFLWRSIRNVDFPGGHCWERDLSAYRLDMTLGGVNETAIPISNSKFQVADTLEKVIRYYSGDTVAKMALVARGKLFDGEGGVRRMWKRTAQDFFPPLHVPVEGATFVIPKIAYDLGMTLWQQHRELSRTDLLFSLAVEDCIRGSVSKATRFEDDQTTELSPLDVDRETADKSTQVVALMPEFVSEFDFNRIDEGECEDSRGAPRFVPDDAILHNPQTY